MQKIIPPFIFFVSLFVINLSLQAQTMVEVHIPQEDSQSSSIEVETHSQPRSEKIFGWSDPVPNNVNDLDTSQPVEIEEFPQEKVIAEPLEGVETFALNTKGQAVESLGGEKSPNEEETISEAETIFVTLQGLDKVTAHVFTFDVRVGEAVQFKNLTIIPHYCKMAPPEDPPETTVFLEIHEKTYDKGSQKVFSGWMFASSPASSAMEHPIYDVWVKGAYVDSQKLASSKPEGEKMKS